MNTANVKRSSLLSFRSAACPAVGGAGGGGGGGGVPHVPLTQSDRLLLAGANSPTFELTDSSSCPVLFKRTRRMRRESKTLLPGSSPPSSSSSSSHYVILCILQMNIFFSENTITRAFPCRKKTLPIFSFLLLFNTRRNSSPQITFDPEASAASHYGRRQ